VPNKQTKGPGSPAKNESSEGGKEKQPRRDENQDFHSNGGRVRYLNKKNRRHPKKEEKSVGKKDQSLSQNGKSVEKALSEKKGGGSPLAD